MTETARSPVTLSAGAHEWDGTDDCPRCLFEAYNLIKRQQFTDACPPGVSPVLHAFGMQLNDCLPDETRQALTRYLPNGDDPLAGTALDGKDETRSYMALDWMVRTWLLRFLELSPRLSVHAASVRKLRRIDSMESAEEAGVIVRAAHAAAHAAAGAAAWDAAGAAARDAAWDAAGDAAHAAAHAAAGAAAGDAAGDAARDAAWDAAGDAARDAAWDAAGDAAHAAAHAAAGDAARDAARDAAWDAAGDAAGDALRPVVVILQESALALYDQMIRSDWA
jgi:hypothetical protein